MAITSTSTSERHNSVGIFSDVVWLAFIGFISVSAVLKHYKEQHHSDVLSVAAMGILLLTALWMPLRLTSLLVSLAERRRREEMAMASVEPRSYLRGRLKRTLTIPSLVACVSAGLLMMDLTSPRGEKWFLPVLVITVSSIALLASATSISILFRWLCRSSRHTSLSWLASFLAVLGMFAYVFLVQLSVEGLKELFRSVPDTMIMTIFYPFALAVTFVLARRAWRRCWTKYFVFD